MLCANVTSRINVEIHDWMRREPQFSSDVHPGNDVNVTEESAQELARAVCGDAGIASIKNADDETYLHDGAPYCGYPEAGKAIKDHEHPPFKSLYAA